MRQMLLHIMTYLRRHVVTKPFIFFYQTSCRLYYLRQSVIAWKRLFATTSSHKYYVVTYIVLRQNENGANVFRGQLNNNCDQAIVANNCWCQLVLTCQNYNIVFYLRWPVVEITLAFNFPKNYGGIFGGFLKNICDGMSSQLL